MKKRSIIVGILIVLLCAAWAWRYTTLNHVYKNLCAQKELHEIGDVVPFGQDYIGGACIDGYSLRVDQFDIVDFGEYISSSDLVDVDDYPSHPEKLALTYITLFNGSSDAEGVMLTDLALHGVDNYVGLDWELLTKLNLVLQGNFGIHLSPNTEYQLVLPFDLQKAFFGSDTWRHLDKYSMYLHMTSFPMEKDIKVQ